MVRCDLFYLIILLKFQRTKKCENTVKLIPASNGVDSEYGDKQDKQEINVELIAASNGVDAEFGYGDKQDKQKKHKKDDHFIDRASRFAFPSVYIIFLFTYFIYYLNFAKTHA